jgi:hypothetical protein
MKFVGSVGRVPGSAIFPEKHPDNPTEPDKPKRCCDSYFICGVAIRYHSTTNPTTRQNPTDVITY